MAFCCSFFLNYCFKVIHKNLATKLISSVNTGWKVIIYIVRQVNNKGMYTVIDKLLKTNQTFNAKMTTFGTHLI